MLQLLLTSRGALAGGVADPVLVVSVGGGAGVVGELDDVEHVEQPRLPRVLGGGGGGGGGEGQPQEEKGNRRRIFRRNC